MLSRGLQLAHHKTEAVMLTKKWSHNPPRLSIGGTRIQLSSHLRYLGVILDYRLSFVKHSETVAKKAAISATALSRLMPNIGGPGQWKRRLLCSVVESQLLYAVPVWSSAVNATAKARSIMRRPQRVAALRTIRAYRTVSDEAAFLLAHMPPVDLIAGKRARIKARVSADPAPGDPPLSRYRIKREERKVTINEWQRKWLVDPSFYPEHRKMGE
uniref:Retrovirus-related Pol polyprotein from type-1 retrotransposable element R1 n=1 Tax=Schizaphis graminum TaxID=13262 RepID=A0A2S2P8X3_SCHGA